MNAACQSFTRRSAAGRRGGRGVERGAEHARKRILDACDKLFRWGPATRGQLTEEQRERLNAMSLDEVIVALP